MNNVTICPKCNKTLISEEFDDHVCLSTYKPTKYIHVYYTDFFTVRNNDGTESAVAEDKDGTIFLIDPINRKLPDENLHDEKTDGELKEPNFGLCCDLG